MYVGANSSHCTLLLNSHIPDTKGSPHCVTLTRNAVGKGQKRVEPPASFCGVDSNEINVTKITTAAKAATVVVLVLMGGLTDRIGSLWHAIQGVLTSSAGDIPFHRPVLKLLANLTTEMCLKKHLRLKRQSIKQACTQPMIPSATTFQRGKTQTAILWPIPPFPSAASLFVPSPFFSYLPFLPSPKSPRPCPAIRRSGECCKFLYGVWYGALAAKAFGSFWGKEICLIATIMVLFVGTKMSVWSFWTKMDVSWDYIMWMAPTDTVEVTCMYETGLGTKHEFGRQLPYPPAAMCLASDETRWAC